MAHLVDAYGKPVEKHCSTNRGLVFHTLACMDTITGVRRLFSRGGQNFAGGAKNILFA